MVFNGDTDLVNDVWRVGGHSFGQDALDQIGNGLSVHACIGSRVALSGWGRRFVGLDVGPDASLKGNGDGLLMAVPILDGHFIVMESHDLI